MNNTPLLKREYRIFIFSHIFVRGSIKTDFLLPKNHLLKRKLHSKKVILSAFNID